MKRSIFFTLIVLVLLTGLLPSCTAPYQGISGGRGGCGAWWPRKFERDKRYWARWNWVNNPRSGRYRTLD